jgi:hypothetical protein
MLSSVIVQVCLGRSNRRSAAWRLAGGSSPRRANFLHGTCDIPFSYTQEGLLNTGLTIVTKMDDGIYYGVNSYCFKMVISEKKI